MNTTPVTQQPVDMHVVTSTQRLIRLIVFLICQFTILFVTGILYTTLPGLGFYLSTFVALEFLFGLLIFFVLGQGEDRVASLFYKKLSLELYEGICLLLKKLDDIQQVQETTDSRLAVVEEKLPRVGIVKRTVDGTSQPIPSVNPPTISGRKRNATTAKAKAATPSTD